MDGTAEPVWWVRHRNPLSALLFAGMFTLSNTIAASLAEGWDIVRALDFALIAFVPLFVGFLLVVVLITRLTASRDSRPSGAFALTASPASRLPPPFLCTERWLRQAAVQVVGGSVFLGIVVWLLLVVPFSIEIGVTLALLAVLLGMFTVSVAMSYGERSFRVDITGVHVRRPLHRPIDVTWPETAAIMVVPATASEVMFPRFSPGFTRIFALRDQEGRMRGAVSPFLDLSRMKHEAFEDALRAHAAAHGIPLTTLSYREYVHWVRASKRDAARAAP